MLYLTVKTCENTAKNLFFFGHRQKLPGSNHEALSHHQKLPGLRYMTLQEYGPNKQDLWSMGHLFDTI